MRRQGIAALHFQDEGHDVEGANPLAPPAVVLDQQVPRP